MIATLVCSRSMRPVKALILASMGEFIGPLVLGTAVAQTIATSILNPDMLEKTGNLSLDLMVMTAVGGAIAWKLPTWYLGLPSSGSHALIGGLVGSGIVGMGVESISIQKVFLSVIIPMLISPDGNRSLLGLGLGICGASSGLPTSTTRATWAG